MGKVFTHWVAATIGAVVGVAAYAVAAAAKEPWYECGGLCHFGPCDVVHCADCKHSNIQKHTGDEVLTCWVHKSHGYAVKPDHYCGYGETDKEA